MVKNMHIKKLFDLKGKIAVVTGGSGYLGSAITESLAEAGAFVYVTGRDVKKLQKFQKENYRKLNNLIKTISLDILSEKSVKECFTKIKKNEKRIDILVNNASYVSTGTLEKLSDSNWNQGLNGTVTGVFRCTKQVIPIMEKNGGGTIINISSIYGEVSPDPAIYGHTGFNNPPQYGAGKAAIIQFTKYCACNLAHKGIRVNTILPGPFPKKEIQRNKQFIKNLTKKIPLGRIGKPYELKGAVVFLASESSSYITGEVLHVDGGWTAW
jgi:gluconate 5-dehydrogenase